ncbi:diguanylate cyclase [Paeniroseomonas aquatica]|uniref:diguanylate cyclase n=2 Tax=Paeniroseomonas aquatica TaxID=373043 RepID=A0ABT8AGL6_9PROT|nr:diguanylate cyclase [Paeniroseomonas aquatica]MDN3568825.1 diguanylate cyclase [Paeniroseomonas aquatica]
MLSLLAGIGMCALSGTVILQLRRDTWAHARSAATNLNRAVGQDILRTLSTLDLGLQGVVEQLSTEPDAPLKQSLHSPLLDRSAMAPYLGDVLVLDEAGRVLRSLDEGEWAVRSFADRDYFRVHQTHPGAGLFVSQPFLGPIDDQWLLGLSHAWSKPDGSFGGVVVAMVRLDYFREIFSSLTLGQGARITLFRDDGIALMRLPYQDTTIGRDFSRGTAFRAIPTATEGSYRSVSSRDRIERFYVFRRLDSLPLIISLGLAIDEIEEEWRVRSLAIGGTTLILVASLVGAGLLLRRELGRRLKAEMAARESEASFRLLAENTGDMVSRIGPDGIRSYVSPAAQRITGRPPDQMIGRPAAEEIHAEDLPQLITAVGRLRSREIEEETVTYRTWRADGAEIWLESVLRTVIHPITGVLDGLVAVSRDVTVRKTLESQLSALARLDGLTGVANRRAFDEAIGREWTRCQLAGAPLSIIMVDVDRFKDFNDRYGHQGGDACLRVVAATVGATIRRAGDLVARYGGEEFAVLLPETDLPGALAVAERLRQEVAALRLPHIAAGPGTAAITVSVGVATMLPAARRGAPGSEVLIEAADRALYEAKQKGRNRVVSAGPIDPLEPVPSA